MAEKNYKIKKIVSDIEPSEISGILILWENLVNGDTGKPVPCWMYADKSIQVIGTFGSGGTCTIQGSNMDATPTWATLVDPQGNALAITGAKTEAILENTYQIRPNVTAGDGSTDLDVYLLMK
jgi:hypothetical protein